MKKYLFLCYLVTFAMGQSCNRRAEKSVGTPIVKNLKQVNKLTGTPVMKLVDITKSFPVFWNYYTKYAQLSQPLAALDENGKSIDRGIFLKKINSGKYFPLVVYGKDEMNFKLALIPKGTPKDIGLTLSNYANKEMVYYQMEGKKIPHFSFQDLNGKYYSSESTKGKIVLFKCWFITCQVCVEEMPALNELIARYKDRDDILYISLTIDQKDPLKQFLATTKFDYVTIPNQKKYMENELNVQVYPTHFIINKKGILVKAVDDEKLLEEYLERELAAN